MQYLILAALLVAPATLAQDFILYDQKIPYDQLVSALGSFISFFFISIPSLIKWILAMVAVVPKQATTSAILQPKVQSQCVKLLLSILPMVSSKWFISMTPIMTGIA